MEKGYFRLSRFSSDCFVKASFIAVAQLLCLCICFGFKESPKVIYSISSCRRVSDEALLKLPDCRLKRVSLWILHEYGV